MNILQDTDMLIGGSYIYSKVNSDYKTPQPLNSTDPIDRALDYVFNSDNTFNTYEIFTSIGYHPTINEYKPYIRGDIRYFDTKIDDPFATISDTVSTISKLKVGVITPPITSIKGFYQMPMTYFPGTAFSSFLGSMVKLHIYWQFH